MNQVIFPIKRRQMTDRSNSQREDINYVGDNSAIFLRYVFKIRFFGELVTQIL